MGGDKREGRGRERTITPMAMVFLHNSMRGKEVMELPLDPRGRCGDYRRSGQGSRREFLERHEYDGTASRPLRRRCGDYRRGGQGSSSDS